MTTPDFNNDPYDTDRAAAIGGYMPQLFGQADPHSWLTTITKEQGIDAQPTNQNWSAGTTQLRGVPQPVDIHTIRTLKDISPHHASCIQSKKNSMVGLGFVSEGDDVEQGRNDTGTSTAEAEDKIISLLTGESFVESKVDKVLDPFTIDGFANELNRVTEDFLDGGTGYLEVVRNGGNFIIGLNWIPYENVSVKIVKDSEFKSRIVYECTNQQGGLLGGVTKRICSMFGLSNRQWVYDTFYTGTQQTKEQVSEIIAFKSPSNMSRWYGYPDWLSASSFVTLLALSLQYKSDFYTNRGVLAYVLSIAGNVDSAAWKKIESMVQGSVGGGNNFRNLAVNVSKDSKVQLDKLASSDKTELQFAKDTEVYSQNIVSAHRVPPVLANILIPGKLGASNEAVQSLITFQLLNIGPKQNIFQQTLGRTLGGDEENGGIKELQPEDFRLRKITSQFDIQGLDTVGRMREEAATATDEDGSKRDVSEGVKD